MTILPVLDNDTDPDGDVLVITNVSPVPETVGRLDLIDGGRALQFTPAANAAGGASFRYTVSDGRCLARPPSVTRAPRAGRALAAGPG